jgi:hypothetical protein
VAAVSVPVALQPGRVTPHSPTRDLVARSGDGCSRHAGADGAPSGRRCPGRAAAAPVGINLNGTGRTQPGFIYSPRWSNPSIPAAVVTGSHA